MRRLEQDIVFQGLAAPLRLSGAEEILPLLREIAQGWPFRLTACDLSVAPFFTISAEPGTDRLRCQSHVDDRPAQFWDPLNAVCDVMAALAVALPMADPGLICLHSAGVEMGGRLVVFPNIRRAGKSTLSAALARAGHRVFSDDVVPVAFPADGPVLARAMGIAPRLRLPLPESLSPGFRDWAAGVPGPRNRQYHYLSLPGQPVHGEALPIGAFVILDRRDVPTSPRLTAVAPDAAMDALLHQNFTRDRHSGEVLDVIAATLSTTPVWQLVYADLDEAVACLVEGCAGWGEDAPPGGEERRFGCATFDFRPDPLSRLVGQRPGCVERWIGEVLYLADPEGRAIQRMDPLAAAIWEMLEEPVTEEELEETLGDAFPDTPRDRIRADLRALLKRLGAAGLIGTPGPG